VFVWFILFCFIHVSVSGSGLGFLKSYWALVGWSYEIARCPLDPKITIIASRTPQLFPALLNHPLEIQND